MNAASMVSARFRGVTLVTPRDQMAGLVCFQVIGYRSGRIEQTPGGARLHYSIESTSLLRQLVARVSCGWWLTEEEIDGLLRKWRCSPLPRRPKSTKECTSMAGDLLLINGRIKTMDPGNPIVDAIAIRNGVVVAARSNRRRPRRRCTEKPGRRSRRADGDTGI